MAKLIVVEGPDKVGKETQSKILTAYLQFHGHKAIRVEVPVRDGVSHKPIYWMLKAGHALKYPNLFQWIQYVNKRLFQDYVMPKLDKEYDFIVLDRWSLSAEIYGFVGGATSSWTKELVSRLRVPDMTIVLDGPPHVDCSDDAYESNKVLQNNVRIQYNNWAAMNAGPKCQLISAVGQRTTIHDNIVNALFVKGFLWK